MKQHKKVLWLNGWIRNHLLNDLICIRVGVSEAAQEVFIESISNINARDTCQVVAKSVGFEKHLCSPSRHAGLLKSVVVNLLAASILGEQSVNSFP